MRYLIEVGVILMAMDTLEGLSKEGSLLGVRHQRKGCTRWGVLGRLLQVALKGFRVRVARN